MQILVALPKQSVLRFKLGFTPMERTSFPLQQNVSLLAHNTFGLDARAAHWLEISHEDQLVEAIRSHHLPEGPMYVLGGGSNVLITEHLSGLVIKNSIRGIEVMEETAEAVVLRVGAGENWHGLVLHALSQDWGGIENLSLIPGCVGAAPIQNIGAYGVELKDVFVQLEAVDLRDGSRQTFDAVACAFGYRDSVFKRAAKGRYLIARVWLRLSKPPHALNTSYGSIQTELAALAADPIGIREVSEVVCRIRQSKLPDPRVIGNAGSFFKNPVISGSDFAALHQRYPDAPHYRLADGKVKVPAGWLIQCCGWKGHSRGTHGVHDRQALVLVHHGGARGTDILALASDIQQDVQTTFGISLEREVNVW